MYLLTFVVERNFVGIDALVVTLSSLKPAFHDADTDTNTNILADILARIVARMLACRSACHGNNFRESRVSDVRM